MGEGEEPAGRGLSARELRSARLLGAGMDEEEAGKRCGVSARTIRRWRGREEFRRAEADAQQGAWWALSEFVQTLKTEARAIAGALAARAKEGDARAVALVVKILLGEDSKRGLDEAAQEAACRELEDDLRELDAETAAEMVAALERAGARAAGAPAGDDRGVG